MALNFFFPPRVMTINAEVGEVGGSSGVAEEIVYAQEGKLGRKK